MQNGAGMKSGPATVSLLFTDLVGSTAMGDRLGDERADHLRREHFSLLREELAKHRGREVKTTGDGLMAAFASAVDAVDSAVAIQRRLADSNREEGLGLQVRVGLNAGDAVNENDDYFGTAVTVAARLCAAAKGGQIIASDLVRGLAGSRGEHKFVELGALELKGLARPVLAWEVAWDQPINSGSASDHTSADETPPLAQPPLAAALVVDTPLVGRAPDLERIEALWREVTGGALRLVMLAGEPGIGKTRLAAKVAEHAHAGGATIMYGRCDEETLVPYQPFVEAIGEWARAAPQADVERRVRAAGIELARLVPDIAQRANEASRARADDPETERYRLFESVSALLSSLSRDRPLLLVLDDLHWSDRPSLSMLRHVLRQTHASPILVLGTYRETDLDRRHPLSEALADIRRAEGYKRVLLRGLSLEEVTAFLATLGQHEVSGRGLLFSEALHRETEGNPFFLQEILRHLIETGKLFQRDGTWVFDAKTIDDLGIPQGVREVIGQRLSRLSDASNNVLSLAAVLGRSFEFAILAKMAEADELDALDAVEESLDHDLIVEAKDRTTPTYSFDHALLRQTLYEELSLPRKQRLHLRAAEAIEKVHDQEIKPHVAALALHYRMAGAAADPARTLNYSLQAGEAAYGVFAHEEAIAHWSAALELMEAAGGDAKARARLLEQLGDANYLAGADWERGMEYLESALRANQDLGDQVRSAQVHAKLGRNYSVYWAHLDIHKAIEHFRAAEAVLGSGDPLPSLAYLYGSLALAHLWAADFAAAGKAAERGVEIAEALGSDLLWSAVATNLAWHRMASIGPSEGFSLARRALAIADRADHGPLAFGAAWVYAGFCTTLGDPKVAIEVVRRELAQPRISQASLQRESLTQQLGWSLHEAGDLAGFEEMREVLDRHRFTAGLGAAHRGEWDEADSIFRQDVEMRSKEGAIWLAALTLLELTQLSSRRGEPERARDWCAQLCEMLGGQLSLPEVLARCRWAMLEAESGNVAEAEAQLGPVRDRMAADEDWLASAGLLMEAEALLTEARGDRTGALVLIDSALERFQRYPVPWLQAQAYENKAKMLARAGDVAGAGQAFDAAVAVYKEIGAGQAWVESVESMRRSTGST